ncbi:hypothetical protein [Filimonas effusa]|uniref:Uncharacterized protein n=1 Tax=Filimonas effusa TaxID=2508721 RepID=A0A4Q1D2N3_9BACT|nr:hypothetical protein [Filimonas effusa]RXK81341.1 hypothetical protein ESB13_20610 [Filimonas effusa]
MKQQKAGFLPCCFPPRYNCCKQVSKTTLYIAVLKPHQSRLGTTIPVTRFNNGTESLITGGRSPGRCRFPNHTTTGPAPLSQS